MWTHAIAMSPNWLYRRREMDHKGSWLSQHVQGNWKSSFMSFVPPSFAWKSRSLVSPMGRPAVTAWASGAWHPARWARRDRIPDTASLKDSDQVKIARLMAVLFLARRPLSTRKLSQYANLADGTEARTLVTRLNQQLAETTKLACNQLDIRIQI